MHGNWAAKNSSSFARTNRLRNTTWPDASAPCAWKTRFAISNPIVLACPMDAPSSGWSTPPLWHVDAVGGCPPYQGRLSACGRNLDRIHVSSLARRSSFLRRYIETQDQAIFPIAMLVVEPLGELPHQMDALPTHHHFLDRLPLGW
jgi:hypothetical protein